MIVANTAQEFLEVRASWPSSERVVLVPTMGALHEGHASLIRMARSHGQRVVVSIFVNPLQFGPNEDLSQYPRPRDADLALCDTLGVDAVFYPTVADMYPEGMENVTLVVPPSALTHQLCGAFRPDHFTGVATVVLKLFQLISPHAAIFGEKDAQQLMVIRKMVRDLQVPVVILSHPVVREADGLAMSSRNCYLSTEFRQTALILSAILHSVIAEVAAHPAQTLSSRTTLDSVANAYQAKVPADVDFKLQYLEAIDSMTFLPSETLATGQKLMIAAYVGPVRLIDVMIVP